MKGNHGDMLMADTLKERVRGGDSARAVTVTTGAAGGDTARTGAGDELRKGDEGRCSSVAKLVGTDGLGGGPVTAGVGGGPITAGAGTVIEDRFLAGGAGAGEPRLDTELRRGGGWGFGNDIPKE